MSALNRQDTPPSPGPAIEIVRVKANVKLQVVICSPSIWGVWTHWDGYRTKPCTAVFVHHDGDDSMTQDESSREQAARLRNTPQLGTNCPGHLANQPLRWKGYLFVFDYIAKREVFVELTPSAATQIGALAPQGENLRGLLLKMSRAGNGNKTRVIVELSKPGYNIEALPRDRDPEKVLTALWNWPSHR